jgi:hypothetical protein
MGRSSGAAFFLTLLVAAVLVVLGSGQGRRDRGFGLRCLKLSAEPTAVR